MLHLHWITLVATTLSLDICVAITTPIEPASAAWVNGKLNANVYERCITSIGERLDSMRKRDNPTSREGEMDLSGYALHHPLTSRSYDMYVTGMRVRVPGKSAWFRVEQCIYDPHNHTLDTRLLFKDLAISGQVKLYAENDLAQNPRTPVPVDSCNMTIRFRRAGLGLTATPQKSTRGHVDIETQARFFEPNFVSVYAYGCHAPQIEHRRGGAGIEAEGVGAEEPREGKTELREEMEDVFLRGTKSLLTSYLGKQLQPALRETLMMNLGYTLSYGKR